MTGSENHKPGAAAAEPWAIAPDAGSSSPIPDYLARVLDEFAGVKFEVNRLSRRPLPDRFNPLVVCVVKNERDRLADLLRHYRSAGIERFVFIDNQSADGTFEFLQRQPDIDLYRRPGKFDWMRKQGWINKIIEIYGHHRWYIYADADEHIVFDGIPERSFGDLTREMERRGIRRVRGFLVDMYGAGAVLQSHYVPGASLAAAYPFFDREGYRETVYREVVSVKGGPRLRAFGAADPKFLPELTKYPLFSTEPGEYMANPHHIWPYGENFKSERYLAILHYKFLPGIMTKLREAISAKNYWDGSLEYRCYAKVLQADPSLSLIAPISTRLDRPADLVELGLIARLDWPQKQDLASQVTLAWRRHLAALIAEGAAAPSA